MQNYSDDEHINIGTGKEISIKDLAENDPNADNAIDLVRDYTYESDIREQNFDGFGNIAVLTSLYPEHLDWHGDLSTYYADKANLLSHADSNIINYEATKSLSDLGNSDKVTFYGSPENKQDSMKLVTSDGSILVNYNAKQVNIIIITHNNVFKLFILICIRNVLALQTPQFQ